MIIYLSTAIKGYFRSYVGLPLICWQGILLNFIESILGGVCFYLTLFFVNVLHINIATAGIIISAYGLGKAVGGIFGGKLSDKLSAGYVAIGCLFLEALFFLLLVKIKSSWWLIINLFAIGMASYGFITANTIWVVERSKHDDSIRLKAINFLYVASNLGMGSSAIIVGLLASYGFHNIFLFCGVLLFLSAIYLFYINENLVSISETGSFLPTPKKVDAPITKYNQKIIFLVLGCLFLVGLIIAQLGTTYSIYIQEIFPYYGIKGVSLLFAINSLLIVFFQVPIVDFFSKKNKVMMVGWGAFLVGFSMFMLSFSYTFVIAIIACVIYTLGEMLFFSPAQFICYQKADNQKKRPKSRNV